LLLWREAGPAPAAGAEVVADEARRAVVADGDVAVSPRRVHAAASITMPATAARAAHIGELALVPPTVNQPLCPWKRTVS